MVFDARTETRCTKNIQHVKDVVTGGYYPSVYPINSRRTYQVPKAFSKTVLTI